MAGSGRASGRDVETGGFAQAALVPSSQEQLAEVPRGQASALLISTDVIFIRRFKSVAGPGNGCGP